MPRHAKSTKIARDSSMLAGFAKHATGWTSFQIGIDATPADVAARLQAHLDAMEEVRRLAIAWRSAVAREQELEDEIKELIDRVQLFLRGRYGAGSGILLEFGLKPRAKAKISAATKAVAVVKRRATRAARRTMGAQQRRRA